MCQVASATTKPLMSELMNMTDNYRTAPLRIEPSPPILPKCPCSGCMLDYINNHKLASQGNGPACLPCTGPVEQRKVRKSIWGMGVVVGLEFFVLIFGLGSLGQPDNL